MSQTFYELVVGDVLIAPFVTYAACALAIFLVLRLVLARIGFEALFSAPPVAMASLYVVVLALLIALA